MVEPVDKIKFIHYYIKTVTKPCFWYSILFILLLLTCKANKLNNELLSIEKLPIMESSEQYIVQIQNTGDVTNLNEGLELEGKSYWDDLCSFINHIYNNYSSYETDDIWYNKNEVLMKNLIIYFGSNESLKRDIETDLPFLEYDISKDGLLRVYCWEDWSGGTFLSKDSIIQYSIGSQPAALDIDEFKGGKIGYSSIVELKNDIYLICGGTRAQSFSYIEGYIALKLINNKLVPVLIFNNNFSFKIIQYHARQFPQKMVIREIENVFTEQEQKIIITYDEVINDQKHIEADNKNGNLRFQKLELKFNGEIFEGDFQKVEDIEKSYWIEQ
jgi:hypothetical protein